MNRYKKTSLAAIACLAFASTIFAGANSIDNLKDATADIPKEKDQLNVQATLVECRKVENMGPYFDNCFAVAVFPTIGKGGLGIGGAHGTGFVFRKGEYTGEAKMTQLSIGWQAGAQAFSQIIFFEKEADYKNFISGEFEFGAQASAVAITAGANATASTAGGASAGAGKSQAKTEYTGGMAIFTMAKGGLMYEAALAGQKFRFRHAD